MKTVRKSSPAFSLVEVTLALGLATFCLLSLFGLLTVGMDIHRAAAEQTRAVNLLSTVSADLKSTLKTSTTSPLFALHLPNDPTSGGATQTLYFSDEGNWSPGMDNTSRFRVDVSFPVNAAGSRRATLFLVRVTWPAPAEPGTSTTKTAEIFSAIDRN